MNSTFDLVINNGQFFDGTGAPAKVCHLGIKDSLVVEISTQPLEANGARTIDAAGKWVMPGFIDTHTHYDAEVVVTPGLEESVRHGVTTVVTGSCSLSLIYSNPLDCADLYSRVEALPYEPVLEILKKHRTWSDAASWIETLNNKALGPNVASMLGHSDIRAKVMGLGRATSGEKATKEEEQQMVDLLEESVEAGFVGLSTMTNPWDKLAGDRFRSRSLPSTYASWREYGLFHRVLRRTGRILQSAPNLNTKVNILLFFAASAGLFFRKTLKTSLISAADPKATPLLAPIFGALTSFVNWLTRSEIKWQAIPRPFTIYADGIDLVVFEEFGAGAEAMHLADQVERNELLKDEAYRRRFRKDYEKRFTPRVWHRDFHDAEIVGCPDASVIGKSVGQVADERGIHVCDAFLDLVVAYGTQFRWKTTLANHRPHVLQWMLKQPHVQVGFADSGAHLRNMAFYNFPLHMLKQAKDAQSEKKPFMTVERAVHRMTAELADWLGLDAGTLDVGRRADIAIIDPEALDDSIFDYHEAEMTKMGGIKRMVRRNDKTVVATIIGGQIAFEKGQFAPEFGTRRYGRFLRANIDERESISPVNETLAATA